MSLPRQNHTELKSGTVQAGMRPSEEAERATVGNKTRKKHKNMMRRTTELDVRFALTLGNSEIFM